MADTDDSRLAAALAVIRETGPAADSRWRHRKGTVYTVLGCGLLETDLSPVVMYLRTPGGLVWVRPLAEFLDGRFVLVTEANADG